MQQVHEKVPSVPSRSSTIRNLRRKPTLTRSRRDRRLDTENSMNWDQIEGNWKQFTGKIREQWGKLTDDEVAEMAGNKDQLVGKIQAQYGLTKEQAEEQVDTWRSGL
jgi:uncharacterized protein YjbJ (UPF0337 family)